jgi:hypothetical protein
MIAIQVQLCLEVCCVSTFWGVMVVGRHRFTFTACHSTGKSECIIQGTEEHSYLIATNTGWKLNPQCRLHALTTNTTFEWVVMYGTCQSYTVEVPPWMITKQQVALSGAVTVMWQWHKLRWCCCALMWYCRTFVEHCRGKPQTKGRISRLSKPSFNAGLLTTFARNGAKAPAEGTQCSKHLENIVLWAVCTPASKLKLLASTSAI